MQRSFATAALTLAVAAPAAATASPRDQLLVDAAWLARHAGDKDLVILQIGDAAAYKAGHIPGARRLSLQDFAAPMGGDLPTLELPDPDVLHAKLIALGVTDRSRIVVAPSKEAGVQSATRIVFTLQAAGLGSRTVLLDGGTAAWAAAGQPLATDTPPPPAASGRLSPIRYARDLVVDADYVRAHARTPGYKIVDSRLPEFYAGARPGGSPTRPHKPGHIPGAVNVPFNSVAQTADLKLAPAAEIEARFKAAGVKRGDTVIAYCHVGQQATATLFAARTLGLKVKLYDGSFEDWSRRNEPVETTPN